jgi:hypothetical protein
MTSEVDECKLLDVCGYLDYQGCDVETLGDMLKKICILSPNILPLFLISARAHGSSISLESFVELTNIATTHFQVFDEIADQLAVSNPHSWSD